MNRRKLRWKSVSTEEFVKLYLQQEGLWNINHEDYKCHWKRIVAYKEIINGMEKHVGSIDVNDVRTKIKNLRCTYIQELSKIMNHSSDPDNAYEPKITWFAEMDKCLNNIILKRNPANYLSPNGEPWDGETEQIKDEGESLIGDNAYAESDAADEIVPDTNKRKEPRLNKTSKKKTINVKYRWGPLDTEEFVKLYLCQIGLWNMDHEDYKCHQKRIEAYKVMIKGMEKYTPNLTINDVRKKIKNLRSTYSQELHKIMNNSLDPDHIYEPTIPWFAEMDKCLNGIIFRRNTWNCKTLRVDTWGEEMECIKDRCDPLIGDDAFEEGNFVEDDCGGSDISDDVVVVTHDSEENKSITFLKRKIRDESTTAKKDKRVEDDFDVFGKYIASQLRKVSVRKALTLQIEIQNLLTDARLLEV